MKEGTGMNPKIKERIEQIRQGIVPKGYKKTRVGIIPEEWELKKMREILQFKNGVNARKEQYGRGVKFINVLDILNNNYITYENIVDRVDIDDKTLENNKVEYGDVLFQRSSETIEEAGTANVYLGKKPVTFGGFVIRGKKIGEYNPLFMNYLLKGDFYRKQVEQKAAGSTRYNIGQDSLEEIYFIDVQITEQQQIAEILSTWDRAIELKEALIKEKEERKKGLMEKLLTPNSDWKTIRLGDVLKNKTEKGFPELELIAVTMQDGVIRRSELDRKDTSSENKENYKLVEPNDIVYNTMRMWQGVSGISRYRGIVSPAYTVLEPKLNKVDPLFISYLFKLDSVINIFKRYSQGLVKDTLNLKYSNFKNIRLKLPSLDKQNLFAKILNTKDKELKLLKQEVELLKEQKKGLMQLLLTGIVRVGEVEELE